MKDQKYWLGFSLIADIGPKRILQLRAAFNSMEAAWHAGEAALQRAGMPEQLATHVVNTRPTIDLEREMQRIARVDAFLLTPDDADYPTLLGDIDDRPATLYVRGSLLPQDSRAVCVVGTRRATVYGKDAAYALSKELAASGVTIISGLAQGVDVAAHRGALDGGGRTIGVMANGISEVYPAENLELAREIITQGAVLTEMSIGTPPIGQNFPRRNRIMSGMSHGVLVVEAGIKSGALITAGFAADQGRDVFAVPSNIFNKEGRGTNRLIQDGAQLVMGAGDVLDAIDMTHLIRETRTQAEQVAPANDTETALLNLLSNDPIHVDDLVRMTGLPVATVSSTLTLMELKGLARTVGYMQYSLPR
ncbi:MAG: DNA-processing protein DprA [Chloroflexota bacterium]